MNLEEVYNQLVNVNRDIDLQLAAIRRNILAQKPPVHPDDVFLMRDTSGRYMFADLLVAKSNTLIALLDLESARMAKSFPSPYLRESRDRE